MTRRRFARTPAEVTADRLRDVLDRYAEVLDGGERDEISRVIHLVESLAARKAR